MQKKKVLLLPGDGIGQEVTASAGRILEKIVQLEGVEIELLEGLIGGAAIDSAGDPLPKETLELAKECDAVLLGGVGGPKWDDLPTEKKPEKGLLRIRQELDLFANLRPALLFPPLSSASSLKSELVENLDILILRELTGGIYFGEPRGVELRENERVGFNTLVYSEGEIERIARVGFELAEKSLERFVQSIRRMFLKFLSYGERWLTISQSITQEWSYLICMLITRQCN